MGDEMPIKTLEDTLGRLMEGIDLLYVLWVGIEAMEDKVTIPNEKTAGALKSVWAILDEAVKEAASCIHKSE